MSLGQGDIDDVFNLLAETDEDGDSPAFLLPSERKKAVNKQGNKGKRRRPPARKPMVSLGKLLESDSDNIDLGSDNEPEKQEIKSSKGGNTIQKMEMTLTDYIVHAIDKVRHEFVSELNRMLDNSQEEQSMINAFVLGLPGAMEEAVADEIALGRLSGGQRDADKLQTSIDSQLEPIWRVIPRTFAKGAENITMRTLVARVTSSKNEMSSSNEELMDDLKMERAALVSAREQVISQCENSQVMSSMNSMKMEVEANSKRLDIEEQFLKQKRKKLEEMQSEWRDKETTSFSEALSESEREILHKLETMANLAPRSRLRNTINVLGSLLDTVRRSYEDVRNLRVQLELELESLSYAMRPIDRPVAPAPKKKMKAVKHRKGENILGQAKEQIAQIRHRRTVQ